MSGQQVKVEIGIDKCVTDLKKKIQEEFRIPPDQQSLTYKGKTLENGRTLASYDFHNHDTVHMVTRTRGG